MENGKRACYRRRAGKDLQDLWRAEFPKPFLRGNQELELFFYAFDRAGSEVPQVMEIYCDHATGRVVEITLAFPSL